MSTRMIAAFFTVFGVACTGGDETISVQIDAACVPRGGREGEAIVLHVVDSCASPCEEVVSTSCDVQIVADTVEIRATATVELHDMCGAVCEIVDVACTLPPLPAGTHHVVFPDGAQIGSFMLEVGGAADAPQCAGDFGDEDCGGVCG